MLKLIKRLFEVGIVYDLFTGEVIYRSRNIRKCLEVLYELEKDALDENYRYVQGCIDEGEYYVDEFWPSYAIRFRGKDYDWDNRYELRKYMKFERMK